MEDRKPQFHELNRIRKRLDKQNLALATHTAGTRVRWSLPGPAPIACRRSACPYKFPVKRNGSPLFFEEKLGN